jgi:hypothetical protein
MPKVVAFFFFHLADACFSMSTNVALLAELGYTNKWQLKIND